MFVDDDIYVNPRLLISYLTNQVIDVQSFYAGRVFFDGVPYRNNQSKWYISHQEYQNEMYPAFVAAGFILFSSQSLPRFYHASKTQAIFKFDDVYLGILAKYLKITPIDIEDVIDTGSDCEIENTDTIISVHACAPDDLVEIWKNEKEIIGLNEKSIKKMLELV